MSVSDIQPAGSERGAIEHDGPSTRRVKKVTGISHLFAAFGYSMAGVRRLFDETAFRHEVSASVMIFIAFVVVGAHPEDFLVMTVLLLFLAAAEAFNTAIEEIVDKISPEWSRTGMHAKDLGSFAVFCLLAADGLVAIFIIGSRLLSL